jgi:hypothetical protein
MPNYYWIICWGFSVNVDKDDLGSVWQLAPGTRQVVTLIGASCHTTPYIRYGQLCDKMSSSIVTLGLILLQLHTLMVLRKPSYLSIDCDVTLGIVCHTSFHDISVYISFSVLPTELMVKASFSIFLYCDGQNLLRWKCTLAEHVSQCTHICPWSVWQLAPSYGSTT